MKKLFLLVVVVIGFTVASYAQATDNATANAKITTAISIASSNDMNFGAIVPSATAGTVSINPATNVRTGTSVTLTSGGGTISAATFDIAGTAASTFSITLPATALTITNGTGGSMTVDTWTSTPSPVGTIDGTGAASVKVGATLHVGASQANGQYTDAAGFNVTVAYN